RLAAGNRFDRVTCRDEAEQWELHRAAASARRDELDRSAAVPCAADEPFFLQVRQMLMDRRQRGQIEAAADFLQARRVAVVLDEVAQVIEDFTLPFGEREHCLPPVVVESARL